jgi:BirA family biotin operon repressor/biotin-[acetyl-CoA-carboxylase] ligase
MNGARTVPMPGTFRLVHLDSVDSTNAEALRLAAGGERGPLWILADRQTGGRGRHGRPWLSEAGNFYGTLLLTVPADTPQVANLSFVAAIALYDAAEQVLGEAAASHLRLKWPNDLLVSGAKTSGILLESQALEAGELAIAAGIGVNLVHAPEVAARYSATCLSAHGARISPRAFLDLLASAFADWFDRWDMGRNFAVIREAWCARAQGIGGPVVVRQADREFAGIFEALDADGALALRLADGSLRKILAGDVFFR